MFSRPDREKLLPQFVTGDFDSIKDDALEYYRSKNSVQVIETPDQNETDFTKCIRILNEFIQNKPGQHTIYANTGFEGKHIGLIPVGKPCTVTTRGLMWNLEDQLLSFDGLVSTSNALIDTIVHISCDNPLLMTMEYNSRNNKHLF
ncbi:hypothetical protein AHF37_12231 [Paragonimus kellicotti]|nr:hypothetical protein AHF37_12231 [Paragonimus kellicotti]